MSSLPTSEIDFPRLPAQDSNILQQIGFLSLNTLSILLIPLGKAPVVNPDQVDTQPVMVMELPTAPSPPKVTPSNEDSDMQREKYQNGRGGSSTLEFGTPATSSTPTPSTGHVNTTKDVPAAAEGPSSDPESDDKVLRQHCVG